MALDPTTLAGRVERKESNPAIDSTSARWIAWNTWDVALPNIPKAIMSPGGGDIILADATGDLMGFTMDAGAIYPYRPSRILSTGSDTVEVLTATNVTKIYLIF